ncbi:hypothetical protein DYB28_001557 [Aphanomyces astaci]|uniref:DDE-1 domain-containing protein n=1 Tax=Aphanomyces astaci TaxID=112090 RepID=A0A9X8DK39_APHAT|nr:hypothetical protein DYB28_001557 [Aphanomyces astaci]
MLVNGITKCYNADQTGVFYEYLPKRTINARGVTVWVRCGGKDKERATAMLLGDSDGNKYPVFIVLKQRKSTVTTTVQSNINERQGFGPFVWREVTDLMTEISSRLYGNPSAWWNEDISVEFLRFHFGSRLNMADKILLLWDDFSGHFTDKVFAKEARKKKGKMSTDEPTRTAVRQSRRLAGEAHEFGLLDRRQLRMNAQATDLVPLEDNDSARVSTPGRKREDDGSPHVSPPTYWPETQSPLKRPALTSAADLPLVLTSPLARTGTDGRESNAETLDRYTSLVQAEYGGMKTYEEFTRGIEEQKRSASLLFFQQANEDRARLLGIQETQLVEMAEGLRIARAAETHESRRQDEFQKALTYLRDCYTQELNVARAQVTNDANETLHGEAEKNALSWEDRTRELERKVALKWELRTPELRTLKRNHQEEILLVREAARDEDNSKGSVQEALPAALRDLSFRKSAKAVCGNCPILEKEKQDLREALRERERSLKAERCWLRQVEEARSCFETEKSQLREQEATLFRERSVQDLTLSQAYAELERQRAQLEIEQRAVELQQCTLKNTNDVRDIWDSDSVPDGVSVKRKRCLAYYVYYGALTPGHHPLKLVYASPSLRPNLFYAAD